MCGGVCVGWMGLEQLIGALLFVEGAEVRIVVVTDVRVVSLGGREASLASLADAGALRRRLLLGRRALTLLPLLLLVAELAPALRQAGWCVRVTRQADESISLVGRAQVSSDLKANLFLSVHHDSVQLRCLRQVQKAGRVAYETLKPTGGYSLYVSEENPKFDQSYQLAIDLGEKLHALGRPPMLGHADKACGEGRPLLNSTLGIYRYDHLAVLRHNEVPAVLLEVGVITDVQDEAYVQDADHRDKMIAAIVGGIQEFLRVGANPR